MLSPVKRLVLSTAAAAALVFSASLPGFVNGASACDGPRCNPGPSVVQQVDGAVAAYQQWFIDLLSKPVSPFVSVFPTQSAQKQLDTFVNSIFAILGINPP